MKKQALIIITALAALCSPLFGHCQVPCGIYDDNNVISKMHTDWITIEKAAKQITELSKDPSKNAHQLTRWINNKESHAQAIQDTVCNYFLAQRLKTAEAESDKEAYLKKLTLCHKVIVAAMKCKQSTDPKAVADLHNLLHDFEKLFGQKEARK